MKYEDRTPEEIADENDQIVEFGRALKKLHYAAEELESNGHLTPEAYSATENVLNNMEILADEQLSDLEEERTE